MKRFKALVKTGIGAAMFESGYYRRCFRDRALITVFHRVDDSLAGKPITNTEAEFDRYCRFFRRYFIPVTVEELLNRLATGQDISRRVAITFDDGYRDNLLYAAPILERHGLSSCFFITTAFMESQTIPRWDAGWGVRSEWLSWNEVRMLRQRGFELGAHTCTHADLGEVRGEEAEREIAGSRVRLSQELAEPVHLFAYPFGGRDRLSDENRSRVEAAGFRCCLAADGGLVAPTSDPFRLPRVAITPYDPNPYHWAYYLMAEHASRPMESAPTPPFS